MKDLIKLILIMTLVTSCETVSKEEIIVASKKSIVENYIKERLNVDTLSVDTYMVERLSDKRFTFYKMFLNPDYSPSLAEREPIIVIIDNETEVIEFEKIFIWETFKRNVKKTKGIEFNIYSDIEYRVLKYWYRHREFDSKEHQSNFIKEYLIGHHLEKNDDYEIIKLSTALEIIKEQNFSVDSYEFKVIEWFSKIDKYHKAKENVLCLNIEGEILIYDFIEFSETKTSSVIKTYLFNRYPTAQDINK